MTKEKLQGLYYYWLMTKVCDPKETLYSELLAVLHNIRFTYIIEMDENREKDGINLRHRFDYANRYNNLEHLYDIHDNGCSVLEMMIALAMRMEEDIMDNPEMGNRVPQWFWNMIDSLGLSVYSDDNFNLEEVCYIVDRFLNREYEPDGQGGLFTIPNCKYDLRTIEIWYQMNWALFDMQ